MGQTKCPYKCKTFNNEWIKDICPAGHLESQWWWCWGTSSVLMADLESYFSKAAVSGNLNITLSRNRLADTIILPQFSSPPTYFFSKTFLFGFWCEGPFFQKKTKICKKCFGKPKFWAKKRLSTDVSGYVTSWEALRLLHSRQVGTRTFYFWPHIKI